MRQQISLLQLKRRAIIAMCASAGFVVLICVMVTLTLLASRTDAIRQAQQELQISSLTLQNNIDRTITSLDLSLKATRDRLDTPGLAALEPNMRRAILFDGALGISGVVGVLTTDEHGAVVYSYRQQLRPASLADRDYFRALAQHSELGLAISTPVQLSTTGTWGIAIARRIDHPDGTFAGVVSGALDLTYFDQLFSKLNINPQAVIALSTTSGDVIARWPHLPGSPGVNANLGQAAALIPTAPSGFMTVQSPFDHIERLMAYTRFGDYPLVIAVGIPTADILADWYGQSLLLGGGVVALALCSAILSWFVLRELRRRMLAELRSANSEQNEKAALARMETLFSASPDSMLIARVAPNGDYVYEAVNPIWEKMTGISAAVALGQRPADVLPASIAPLIVSAWQQCIETQSCTNLAFNFPETDAARSWEALIVPVISPNGVVQRIIAIARDVTERNRAEAAFQQAQRLESIGLLTAGVAHNFNNLLQAIYGSVEMLHQQPSLDDEGHECVRIASQAARRGAVLVHRLLAFARKQPLAPESVAVQEVMADLTLLLTHTLSARIQVETQVDADVGWLEVDATQLESCLLNLALNARDAMQWGGKLRLHASHEDKTAAQKAGLPSGDYVRFAVEDTGEGMSLETKAQAFEPFYTTKPVGHGTGLGLSMVHGFAKQSGGDVRVDQSSPGGTTISLWLPAVTPAYRPAISKPNLIEPTRGPKRIMVVDDEEIVCRMLAMSLRKSGFQTITASSAEAALEILKSDEICDLLVTDQSMPGLSGTELIAEVSRLRPSLQSILISGYDMVSGMDYVPGKTVVLQKPFEQGVLREKVLTLLGQPAGAKPTGWPNQPAPSEVSNVIALHGGAAQKANKPR